MGQPDHFNDMLIIRFCDKLPRNESISV
jgi:hypothetical protein